MRKTLYAIILMGLMATSCNKEPQPMSKQEMKFKTDSLTKVQIQESNKRAQTDLEYRIKIEVKVLADSIVKARQSPNPVKDTTAKDTTKKPVAPRLRTGFLK